jgi:hypothetical protein
MADPARVIPIIDQEVEQALSLCGGDPLKALQVTLIANAFLEARIDQLTAEAATAPPRHRVQRSRRKAS